MISMRKLWHQAAQQVSLNALKSIGLGVVALLFALAVLMGTNAGRTWASQQLLWWVNQNTAWLIETKHLESHRLGHWQVQTLRVYAPNQSQPLIQLHDLDIALPWQFGLKTWHIEHIKMARAEIHLQHRNDAGATQPLTWPRASFSRPIQLDEIFIAELNLQHTEYFLNGSLQGNANWQPEEKLPVLNLNWHDANRTTAVFMGRPDEHLWRLTGEFYHNTPATDARQWPEQTPLIGELNLTVPHAAEGIQLDSQWQMPLWLLMPWMPPEIAVGWDDRNAILDAQWQWSLAGNWNVAAHLATPWQGKDASLSLSGSGWQQRIDALRLAATIDDSYLSAVGLWQPELSQSQIDFDVKLKPSLFKPMHSLPAPELVTLQGQLQLLDASGPLSLDLQNFNAKWVLDHLAVSWPAETLLDSTLNLTLTGSGEISGALFQPILQGQWQAHLDTGHEQIAMTLNHSQFGAETLKLNDLEVLWRDSFWRGNLGVNFVPSQSWQHWPIQLNSPGFELALTDLVDSLELDFPGHGRWSGRHQWSGSVAQPKIHLMAQLEAHYLDYPLNGQLNWQDTELRSHVQWQDRVLTLAADHPLSEQLSWQLQLQNMRDSDVAAYVTLPIGLANFAGRHDFTLRLGGHWDSAELSVQSNHSGAWKQAPITATSTVLAQMRSGQFEQWHLRHFSAVWQDATIKASGQSMLGSWWPKQLQATLTEVPLDPFWHELEPLGAVANGKINLTSDSSHWIAELALDINGRRQADLLSGQIRLTASGQDLKVTHIMLKRFAVGFGDTFGMTAEGGFDQQQWDLLFSWDGLALTPPASWPGPKAPWRAHGQLQLTGAADDPNIQLEQTWDSLWVQLDGDTLPWQLNQTIHSTATTHQLSNKLLASGMQQLSLSAQLPRTSWRDRVHQPIIRWPWQAQAHWSVDLSEGLMWLGIDQIAADGLIQGQGQWFGDAQHPKYQIKSQIKSGAVQYPRLGLKGANLDIKVSGQNNESLTLTATGNMGTGQIDLSGALVTTQQPWQINTHIELNKATLLQRPEVQSTVSGGLKLQGFWPNLALTGSLSLDDLHVNLNRIVGSSTPQLDIHNEPQAEPLIWPFDVNVSLTTAGLARVTGNGLDAKLSGDVKLLGSPQAINTEGALRIESGQFSLLTRNFDLTEGQLQLVDEAIQLFIVAVHQRGDVMIEATLRGPLDALQLSLRSDPELPEDEIMAQLLFGKAVQNMTPWQALQLANAINQLRGGDSLDLLLATRNTLGLDTLEIDPADDQQTAAILRIGRYLNSRVYLEVDTELNAERSLTARVEVELTPSLYLESQAGRNQGRVHLRWRLDY